MSKGMRCFSNAVLYIVVVLGDKMWSVKDSLRSFSFDME